MVSRDQQRLALSRCAVRNGRSAYCPQPASVFGGHSRALGQEALSTVPFMPTAATHFRASSQRGNEHGSAGWGSRSPLVPSPTNTRWVPLYSAQDTALGGLQRAQVVGLGKGGSSLHHMGRELAAAELPGGSVRAGGFPSQALLPPVLSGIPASSSCPPRTLPPCQQQPEAAPPQTPGALKAQPARPKPRPVTAESEGGAQTWDVEVSQGVLMCNF